MQTGEQRAGRAISLATRQMVDRFDGLFWAAYQALDELQARTVDVTLDVLTLEALSPRWIDGALAQAREQCGDTARVFGSVRGAQLAYREMLNKIEVVELVRDPACVLGGDAASAANVPRLVDVASALAPFPVIWAIEGLGHRYADWARTAQEPVRLLRAGRLPPRALPMMHAGLGLSVGDHLLRRVTPFDGDVALQAVVAAFADQCRSVAQPGYAGCAYESLGLVTRTLHASTVPALDRAIRAAAPSLRSYFWHGVGRALYFAPLEFVPGVSSPWVRVDVETHDAESRLNATAGLAWATALVNIRQPEIVGDLLPSIRRVVERDDAVESGIRSVLAMALETDPANPFVRGFCGYRPAGDRARGLWAAAVPSIGEVETARDAARQVGAERLFAWQPREGARP